MTFRSGTNYSDDFIYRVKKQFPKPLNKHERAFLSLIRTKVEITNDIDKLLRHNRLKMIGYNIEKEEFEFIKLAGGKYDLDRDYESKFIINLKGNSISGPSKEKFIKKANILIKLDKKISYFQSYWHDIDLNQLNEKIFPFRPNLLNTGPKMVPNKRSIQKLLKNSIPVGFYLSGFPRTIHYLIKNCQENLSLVFINILDSYDGPVSGMHKFLYRKHEFLSRFLGAYDRYESRLTIKDDGSIIREKPNLPESYFINNKIFYPGSRPKRKECIPRIPAHYAISFLLINFLKLPNSVNLINRCHECNNIFIELKKTKNRRFCSDKCRLALHNRRRIESNKIYKRERKEAGKATPSYYGQVKL